jgi:glycosyltransferase involved in cell wall biosynthesis
VRVRALHWIDRLARQHLVDREEVEIHGPGFTGGAVERDEPVLLLRNARRMTRGKAEARLLRRASIGVYDLDDGLPWDDGTLPGLGHWWKRPFPRSVTARRAANAADRVIAGNEVIAEWASTQCDDVVVVPTCVELSEYDVRSQWDIVGAPVLGWIGSPATEQYLFDLTDTLVEAQRRLGFRLEIVSGEGAIPVPLAPFTTRRRWTSDATHWIGAWDVGLMPLRDGLYERAKCGYKLLQYAASGVPAVASPVGVNERLLAEMDGFGPRTDDQWVEALSEAVGESAARREQRARCGLITADRYSYVAWQAAWLRATGW